jgi:hypothetical protein
VTEETQTEADIPQERRPGAWWDRFAHYGPYAALAGWFGAIALVAMARIRPWNEWASWRRWFSAGRRGWELIIPGLLLAAAVTAFVWAQPLWKEDDGWSPRVLGLVLLGVAVGAGGAVWGLYTLGIRPFTP